MKYLNTYNESFDRSVISKIEDYKSDIIIDVNQIGSTDDALLFNITYCDHTSDELKIEDMYPRLRNYRFIIDRSAIMDENTRPKKSEFRLSDFPKIFKMIEDRFRSVQRSNVKLSIKNEMFKVITKQVLQDYFAEVLDNGDNSIIQLTSLGEPIYWAIRVNTNLYRCKNNQVRIDDDFINLNDSLVSAAKRLQELFDVSVVFRYDIPNNDRSGPTLYIRVFANDDQGDPIGIGLS